jgi:hypothetical protein
VFKDRVDGHTRQQIELLLEQMRQTRDDGIMMRLELQVRALDRRLSSEFTIDSNNLDGLIKDIKVKQQRQSREQYANARRNTYY